MSGFGGSERKPMVLQQRKPPDRHRKGVPLIPLDSGLFAILDPDDIERLGHYRWKALKSKACIYAVRRETVRGKRQTIRMHREVMHCPDNCVVHHINKNTLDNRKINLLVVTPDQHKMLRIAKVK